MDSTFVICSSIVSEQILETIVISSESDSDEVDYLAAPQAQPNPNRLSLVLKFDDDYSNLMDIDCQLCSARVPFGTGATIQKCQHSLCPDCVAKAILRQQEHVHCPVKQSGKNCTSLIPTGLVRHALPAQEFREYQSKMFQDLEGLDLLPNSSSFECSICLCPIEAGDGIILRDCIHEFCLECIRQTVNHCEDAQVQCPFADKDYSCTSVLQQREVRGVLADQTKYNRFLSHCLRVAEKRMSDSFHCKTNDCQGWCILEEDQRTFLCPVCEATSCTVCEVIARNYILKRF